MLPDLISAQRGLPPVGATGILVHAAGDQLDELPIAQHVMHEISALASPAMLPRILHIDETLPEALLRRSVRLQAHDSPPPRITWTHGWIAVAEDDPTDNAVYAVCADEHVTVVRGPIDEMQRHGRCPGAVALAAVDPLELLGRVHPARRARPQAAP